VELLPLKLAAALQMPSACSKNDANPIQPHFGNSVKNK
jgi:hypothetical protein